MLKEPAFRKKTKMKVFVSLCGFREGSRKKKKGVLKFIQGGTGGKKTSDSVVPLFALSLPPIFTRLLSLVLSEIPK